MSSNYKSKKGRTSEPEPIDPNWINPLLPVDNDAERGFVAALLDNPKRIGDVLNLIGSGEVLANDAYRAIFGAITGLYAENKPVKLSSVIQRLNASGEKDLLLQRGISLMELPRLATGTDLEETALYLRGLWIKRTAIDKASEVLSAVSAGESVDAIADLAAKFHESITSGMNIGADKGMTDHLRDALETIERAAKKTDGLTGVPTGLPKLDRQTGGWQDSDVILIAGRPGMGKSVGGVYHAFQAAQAGVPTAFLSLEMPTRSLINRLIAMQTGIPYSRIKKGTLEPHEWTTIHHRIQAITDSPLHFYDDANRDVNDLTYKLLHWKKKYGIGLVVIDYVQLMTDRTVRSGDEYAVLTEVSKKLKQLQRRLECPVIELAQLNREVEKRPSRRPGLSDLRGSGQLEQDASMVIMLFREDYYAEKAAQEAAEASGRYEAPERNYKLEYGIAKHRDGQPGTVVLYADMALNRIAESKEGLFQSDRQAAPPTVGPGLANYPITDTSNWYNPEDREPNF